MNLIFIITLIVLVVLFLRVGRLEERIEHLEKRRQQVNGDTEITQAQPILTEQGELRADLVAQQIAQDSMSASSSSTASEPSAFSHFGAWLKEDWLMKLGALLVLLGIGWFVSLAFANNWIGPMGRIALGFVAGAGVLVLGRYRIARYVSQGSILMFVGALTVVLTTWAAREAYGFFTPGSALAIMFLVSAVLGLTSVMLHRAPLAYANILMAAVAPLMTASPEPSLVGLFSYLLVLTVGAIWVATITGWRLLSLLALMTVSLYSIPYLLFQYLYRSSIDEGLLFSFVFTGLFFFVSIMSMRRNSKAGITDVLLAAGSGLFLFAWIYQGAAPEWQSMLFAAWTVIFSAGAYVAVLLGAGREFFYTYGCLGVVFLGIATGLELHGAVLTIAYILEALLVFGSAYLVTQNVNRIPVFALPMIVPVLLSFESMYTWKSLFTADSAVLVLIMVSGFGVGQYLLHERDGKREEEKEALTHYGQVAHFITAVYGLIYIWIAMHVLFTESIGLILALLIYTAIGSWLYLQGRREDVRWKRVIGSILIVLTAGYLLLIAGMILGSTGRIIAAFLIGAALIGVAWHERELKTTQHTTSSNENHHE